MRFTSHFQGAKVIFLIVIKKVFYLKINMLNIKKPHQNDEVLYILNN